MVNPERKSIYLTRKKSLLSSKYPDLTDYSQCAVGLIAEGTILKILDHGLVVKFFGDVQVSVNAVLVVLQGISAMDTCF